MVLAVDEAFRMRWLVVIAFRMALDVLTAVWIGLRLFGQLFNQRLYIKAPRKPTAVSHGLFLLLRGCDVLTL